jgi:site-specific DNA recombinase
MITSADTAIYARLSRDSSGLSENVTIQVAEATDFADERVWPIVTVRSDNDLSASKYTTKPREGYDLLVQDVLANRIEVILITEMPRLYRRIEELLELIRMAEFTRLRAIWTTDDIGYDLSTAEGIHEAIGAVNAAMLESAKISRRVRRKKKANAKRGKWGGGKRPYGFEGPIRDAEGTITNLDRKPFWGTAFIEEEIAIIREVADRFIDGEGWQDIAVDLNRRGYRTPQGNLWRPAALRAIIFKKRNIGIRVHNGVEYKAAWPAILTPKQWDMLHTVRGAKAARYSSAFVAGRKYLLTGYIYCGHCTGPMTGGARTIKGQRSERRYVCRSKEDRGRAVGCGRMCRNADPLEAWVIEAIFYRLDNPEVAKALQDLNQDDIELDELLTEYQACQLKLDELIVEHARRELTKSQFMLAKSVAETMLEDARTALRKAQTTKNRILPADQTIRRAWEESGYEWKQSVIGLLVERVIVHHASPGNHLKWREWGFDPEKIEIVWRV